MTSGRLPLRRTRAQITGGGLLLGGSGAPAGSAWSLQ